MFGIRLKQARYHKLREEILTNFMVAVAEAYPHIEGRIKAKEAEPWIERLKAWYEALEESRILELPAWATEPIDHALMWSLKIAGKTESGGKVSAGALKFVTFFDSTAMHGLDHLFNRARAQCSIEQVSYRKCFFWFRFIDWIRGNK